MDCIYAIRHILRLSETVFVAHDGVSLIGVAGFKAARRFEIDFKGRSFFGSLDLSLAVVRVLNEGDIAFDDFLGHIVGSQIMLYGVEFGVCADSVNRIVKQITFGRFDFTDCPVGIADILFGGELTILVSHILINQGVALVNAVNGSRKSSVALRRSFLVVALGNGHGELFEDVIHASVRDFFPFHGCGLRRGNDIADGGIDFFKSVRGRAADKDIAESRNAAFIGYCVFINRDTA